MATHFVGAVKEHAARLQQWQGPSTNDIVQAAADAILPVVLKLQKQGHTELVRVLRNNPQALVK
jgi:hypothetical protein